MHEEKIPAVFWAINESFFAPCDFSVALTGFFVFYKEPCCYPSRNVIFSSYILGFYSCHSPSGCVWLAHLFSVSVLLINAIQYILCLSVCICFALNDSLYHSRLGYFSRDRSQSTILKLYLRFICFLYEHMLISRQNILRPVVSWSFLVLSDLLILNIPILVGCYKIKCTAVTQLLTHQWMTGGRA